MPRLGIQAFLATILPCVRVPVLSEQISVTAPRASNDLRFLTMTCLWTMCFVPTAIVMVRTTISDAGIMLRPVATA